MSRRINTTVSDDYGDWLDDHPQLSASGLLEWAIAEHKNAAAPFDGADNLIGDDDLIRDPNVVLRQADRQYRHYIMDGEDSEMAALEAAHYVIEHNEYGLVQTVFFAEAILADGPPLSRHIVSEHLIEDAHDDPYRIADELLANVLQGYLQFAKNGKRPEEGEREPAPPTAPPLLPYRSHENTPEDQLFTNPGRLAEQIYYSEVTGSDVDVDSWESAWDIRDPAQNLRRERMTGWSWTEKAQFIETILEDGVHLDIPSEQFDRSLSDLDEIFESLAYWALDAYLEDRIDLEK